MTDNSKSLTLDLGPRTVQVEIPDLGLVVFKHVPMSVVIEAREIIQEIEEGEKAPTFVHFMLSQMIVEPPQTPTDISSLLPNVLEAVIAAAIDLLGIQEEFDETDEALSIKTRFLQAYNENERKLIQSIAETVQNSLQFIAPISQLANVGESLASAFNSMAALHLNIAVPEFPIESILPSLAQTEQIQQTFANIAQLSLEPITKLVDSIANIQLPEPYFSSALFGSGLNSPIIHSPTFTLPDITPAYIVEEVEITPAEIDRRRLVDSYDILSELEQSLRVLIESTLQDLHGDRWWRRAVPQDVREECQERKEAKERPHEPTHHPIYYAYVHDYRKIISRRDNWQQIFSLIFGNRVELEACFEWVGKVRDAVAHVRPLSDDDYLMLVAGARWLQTRIKRALPEETND